MFYREQHCVHARTWPWRCYIGTHKWRCHTSHCDVMKRSVWRFSFNYDCIISVLNFKMNDLYHDSISNKLFWIVFSRPDDPIVISVCGMRSADQDHRIRSEPIVRGSSLESGPARHCFVTHECHLHSSNLRDKIHDLGSSSLFYLLAHLTSQVLVEAIPGVVSNYDHFMFTLQFTGCAA